jgi:replicative DNA helicase
VNEVSDITRGLKLMAGKLGVPVLVLSQLSRAVEARQDKRPMLSDLRDSGSIEQDADVVMFVYRPEYYVRPDEVGDLRGLAEVIVSKQRNGPTGSVSMHFTKEYARFDNLDRGHLSSRA